jgi:hypothetical protein
MELPSPEPDGLELEREATGTFKTPSDLQSGMQDFALLIAGFNPLLPQG